MVDMVSNEMPADPIDILAVSPGDGQSVPRLIKQILLQSKVLSNDGDRLQLLNTTRALTRALETPRETVLMLCWAQPTLYATIDTAINLGLFALMKRSSGTVNQLSELTGADSALLGRLMRHLAAMGVIYECGPDTYKLTNFSSVLTLPKYSDGFPCKAQGAMKAIYKLPEYLAKTGYQNPDGATESPFQFAYNTSQHWFDWARENQPVLKQFNNHMGAYHQGRPSWMDSDFYPVEKGLLIGSRTDADAVLLVDVGGSLGHDLEEFQRKHPKAPGRLVLQDLPAVIEQISNLHRRVEPMVHDFYTEQPIKGARAYYLHSVLHDWPDSECHRILAQIVPAMEPGYSKLLVYENMVPDVGAGWQVTALDLMVMTLVSARERKKHEWQQLLENAGLAVLNIWSHANGVESLIECERRVDQITV